MTGAVENSHTLCFVQSSACSPPRIVFRVLTGHIDVLVPAHLPMLYAGTSLMQSCSALLTC